MSRCLPYGRLIYKREDVSLIGSIKKLQIQWGNTKQRKQVSRKVKEKQNKKRSRVEYDKLDSLQHKNKKRKAEEKNIKLNESCHHSRKEDSYHLERSDLSEELDPPAFVLNKCNSSKSIQNSSKNNAVKDCNPNKNRPGMVIRIKLPLNQHKDLETASASIDPCCSSQVTKSFKDQAFLIDSAPSSQVNNTSKVQAVLTESAPHFSSEVTKLTNVQTVLTESAPRCSSHVTNSSKAQAALTESSPRSSQISKTFKIQAAFIESAPRCSSEVTKSSKAQAALTESASRSSQISKTSKVQAAFTESAPCCSSQVTKSSKAQAVLTDSASRCSQVTNSSKSKSVLTESALRTKEVPSAKQPETCAEPCFSGPVAKAPILHEGFFEANLTESRHKSIGWSCTPKSEGQLFRDLIINWKPPSIQPIEADEGELDWLFAPKKSQDAKSSVLISKAGISNPSPCPSSANSLQPRATYLPEFDMYQMPYVIPF